MPLDGCCLLMWRCAEIGEKRENKTKARKFNSPLSFVRKNTFIIFHDQMMDGQSKHILTLACERAHITFPHPSISRTQCRAKEIRFSMANLLRSRLIKTLFGIFQPFSFTANARWMQAPRKLLFQRRNHRRMIDSRCFHEIRLVTQQSRG